MYLPFFFFHPQSLLLGAKMFSSWFGIFKQTSVINPFAPSCSSGSFKKDLKSLMKSITVCLCKKGGHFPPSHFSLELHPLSGFHLTW